MVYLICYFTVSLEDVPDSYSSRARVMIRDTLRVRDSKNVVYSPGKFCIAYYIPTISVECCVKLD